MSRDRAPRRTTRPDDAARYLRQPFSEVPEGRGHPALRSYLIRVLLTTVLFMAIIVIVPDILHGLSLPQTLHRETLPLQCLMGLTEIAGTFTLLWYRDRR